MSSLMSVTHDELLEADERWIKALQPQSDVPLNLAVYLPSIELLARIYQCLGIFSTVLITSVAIYGGLMLSNSREDEFAFEKWIARMWFFLLMEYAALLTGIIILLQVNLSLIDVKYPIYDPDGPCIGKDTLCYTKNTTFEWMDLINCREYGSRNCAFVNNLAVQLYMKNIIIIFAVGAGLVIVIHFLSRWHLMARILRTASSMLEGILISKKKIVAASESREITEELLNLRRQYEEIFEKEKISADQYHLLTVSLLTAQLKLPLGDALRFHEMEQRNYYGVST